jgi:hypothetical protein
MTRLRSINLWLCSIDFFEWAIVASQLSLSCCRDRARIESNSSKDLTVVKVGNKGYSILGSCTLKSESAQLRPIENPAAIASVQLKKISYRVQGICETELCLSLASSLVKNGFQQTEPLHLLVHCSPSAAVVPVRDS